MRGTYTESDNATCVKVGSGHMRLAMNNIQNKVYYRVCNCQNNSRLVVYVCWVKVYMSVLAEVMTQLFSLLPHAT